MILKMTNDNDEDDDDDDDHDYCKTTIDLLCSASYSLLLFFILFFRPKDEVI